METARRNVEQSEWFAPLFAPELPVFHWHGDTFDLPPGSVHLASTNRYMNQAYAVGSYGLGLQFHPEVTVNGLERWYVGHACELNKAGISVAGLRSDAQKHAPAQEEAAAQFWRLWLDSLF